MRHTKEPATEVRPLLFFIHMKNLTKVSLLTYAGALLIVQNAQIAQQQDALSLLVWVALGALHNGAANTRRGCCWVYLYVLRGARRKSTRRTQWILERDTHPLQARSRGICI
jgi:hypothetical protein